MTDRDSLSPAPGVAGELLAGPAAIGSAAAAAERFANDQGLGPRDRERLRLVVEELATNTLEHGAPAAGSTIAYRLEHAPGVVTITYADRGRPFDPRSLPVDDTTTRPPSGREGGHGWRIIRSWCRIADYRRDGDCNRLLLVMPLEAG